MPHRRRFIVFRRVAEGCGRWFPTLTKEELAVVERYYQEHRAELDEEDRGIRAHVAEQVRLQRLCFPPESRESRPARMKEILQQRKERNGEGNPGRQ